MASEERLMKLLKNLYRAQFMVIDSYKDLMENDQFSQEDKGDIKQIMEDHVAHRDRLKVLLEEAGESVPDTSAKITKWGADIMEFFKGNQEKYMEMQRNLSTEKLLIDLYDLAAIFAQGNEKVMAVIDTNADEDVEHAEFFKEGVLGFAEEVYVAEGGELMEEMEVESEE